MNNPPTVPCKICTEPTTATALQTCAGCWEVTSRLADFLRHAEGRRTVREELVEGERRAERDRIAARIQKGIDECRCGEPGTLFYDDGNPCERCKERARVLGEISAMARVERKATP